ncbi:MAG: hypothetical protein ACFE8P_04420, partial [Promethearchaeota archaeon]
MRGLKIKRNYKKCIQVFIFLLVVLSFLVVGVVSTIKKIILTDNSGENITSENLLTSSGSISWQENGTAICTEEGDQISPRLVNAGNGSAIITWADSRNGNFDIYSQKINSNGITQWTPNGTIVCNAIGKQYALGMVSANNGSAIIVWIDNRSGSYDIYAQKMNSNGIAQWTPNGNLVCNITADFDYCEVISDDFGGAIITWSENRTGNYGIYSQRINSTGHIQWDVNGTIVCEPNAEIDHYDVINDGSGGVIVAWTDERLGMPSVYVQRINSTGIAKWAGDQTLNYQSELLPYYVFLTSAENGNVIVIWYDLMHYPAEYSGTYAQKLNPEGEELWGPNGTQISTYLWSWPISDGSGGALLFRNEGAHIYAQKINSNGNALWRSPGATICSYSEGINEYRAISDDNGGAFITWLNYDRDLFVQKSNSAGKAQWGSKGIPIVTQLGMQVCNAAYDGSGEIFIVWGERRYDDYDIYVQRVV